MFIAGMLLPGMLFNSLEAENSLNVLKMAIREHGKPEIINSDQGSQFTCALWTEYVENQNIIISMDGRGRATDNIYIERLWRTVKRDHIYIFPADNGIELFKGFKIFFDYYNNKKKHQGIGRCIPASLYKKVA